MSKLIESKFGGYEAIPGWREGGDVTLCYTLVTIGIRVSGAIRGSSAHLHWTLDTPDKDNTQSAANIIDDTQNSNYQRGLSLSLEDNNKKATQQT